MKSIIICGTPRTGGNWLCQMLREAGAGQGDEYASRRVFEPLLKEWRVTLDHYWPACWQNRSPGGIFVIKVHWRELRYPWTNGDPKSCVPPGPPIVWVFQTRNPQDAAQSWARSRRTGRWFGKNDTPATAEKEAARLLPFCESDPRSWNKWFAERGIEPIRIPYEDLRQNPAPFVNRILEATRRKG